MSQIPEGPIENDWGRHHWEPFKIAIGAFYALCLQSGFDTTASYYRNHPVNLNQLPASFSIGISQLAVGIELVTYMTWVSMYFLYNSRMYFRLPPHPERLRVTGYANLTASFAAFYFLGANLGPPGRNQVALIGLIIVIDLIFPLHLVRLTGRGPRTLWVTRDAIELGFVIYVLLVIKPSSYNIWWVIIWFTIIVTQLIISPFEYRFQNKQAAAAQHMAASPRVLP